MNRKVLAFAWIACIIFTWFMIAIFWAGAITFWPGDNELPFEEVVIQNLSNVYVIIISLIVGTIAAPCCYCSSQE